MTKERMLGYVAFLHLVSIGKFTFTPSGRVIRWAKAEWPSKSQIQQAQPEGENNYAKQ